MKTIHHITIHVITSEGYFDVAAHKARSRLHLESKGAPDTTARYPVAQLPAFEASLKQRGFTRLPGGASWLRWWELVTDEQIVAGQKPQDALPD